MRLTGFARYATERPQSALQPFRRGHETIAAEHDIGVFEAERWTKRITSLVPKYCANSTFKALLRCENWPNCVTWRLFSIRSQGSHVPEAEICTVPNTYAFESGPMVKATGFREYDARWLLNKEINLMGIQALGMGPGAHRGTRRGAGDRHRSRFSRLFASIKYALISGLLAAGCKVHDIGLAVTPMAYFARRLNWICPGGDDDGARTTRMAGPASRWALHRPPTFGPEKCRLA